MNLKEAFRWQKHLDDLMHTATRMLTPRFGDGACECYTMDVVEHHMYNESNPDKPNCDKPVPPSEHKPEVTSVIEVMLTLIEERAKLSKAIETAKRKAPICIDAEIQTNNFRNQAVKGIELMLSASKPRQINKSGSDYMLDVNKAPVSYVYPVVVEYTERFSRPGINKFLDEVTSKFEETSSQIESSMVNADVDYTPPFSIRATVESLAEKIENNN